MSRTVRRAVETLFIARRLIEQVSEVHAVPGHVAKTQNGALRNIDCHLAVEPRHASTGIYKQPCAGGWAKLLRVTQGK